MFFDQINHSTKFCLTWKTIHKIEYLLVSSVNRESLKLENNISNQFNHE